MMKPMGLTVAATPRIIRMLNTLEPTTLPTAISSSFFRAATTEVTSSGRLVPIATMVRPIRFSERPKNAAMVFALFTTQSPPNLTATAPPTMYTTASHMGMFLISSPS